MSKGRGGRDSPNNDLGSISTGFALLDQEDEARENGLANAGRRKAGMLAQGVLCSALKAPPLDFESIDIGVFEQKRCSKSPDESNLEFEK